MASPNTCLNCGAVLTDDARDGFCPKCLFRLAGVGALRLSPPDEEEIGTSIGRYKLLEKVGEGGFGAVYVAEQCEPVKRRVALKIIKLGMDTKAVIARFEAERQALALMEHPNIAKVYDGGATETGRPYFVMELVRGMRITDYCDQNNLSTERRLELFMQVCHAIQHAHQKGIIHRDIKPSNILVTVLDGQPVPKVIDFGIAKATQGQLTDKTVYTQLHQFIGTPAYMSPEQAALSAVDVDTRSDIYSLGVLLYELLTGHPPFDPKTLLAAGLDEMRRIVREQEPPRPSTRISTLNEAERTTVAKHRRAEPAALSRLVRGDLDWVVMKCLEKNRSRRYETANGLATDIGRHINHEPVMAAAPELAYRAQKFVRRHRVGVAFVAAVVLALATGLSVATWMFLKEKQTRQRLEVRAYVSDMGDAKRTADMGAEMGGVAGLLAPWEKHKPDLRRWEWYYLNGLCHPEILTIQAETNELWSVDWSPDGTRLATGGMEGAVKIWDALSGRQLVCLRGQAHEASALAWSPDGRHLASASADIHRQAPTSSRNSVEIWDVANARKVSTLRVPTNDVFCLAWSPDGARLASGGPGQAVMVWDPIHGTNTQTLQALSTVYSLSWTSDGTRLAAAGTGKTIKVWEMPSGKELWSDEESRDKGNFLLCAWSRDGKQLATAGSGFNIEIRDATTGTTFKSLNAGGNTGAIAWSPQGRWLAAASHDKGLIRIWDTKTREEVQSFVGHLGGIRGLSWQPNGVRIASAGQDGTVKIWDTTKPSSSVTKLQPPGEFNWLAWHPDGSKLTLYGGSSVMVLDLMHPTAPLVLGQLKPSISIAWNRNGTRLASCGRDGVVQVWDPAAQKVVCQDTNFVGYVAWSPDSRRLALADKGGNLLKIWDAANGNQLCTCSLRTGATGGVAWSPDGRLLAVGVWKNVQILDAVSGKERRLLTGHAGAVGAIAWSPDSKRLASAWSDATVRIWDVASGRETQTLLGHAGPVQSVAWSPDGTRVASGGRDKTLVVWEAASGLAICSFGGHPVGVRSVSWSPDGTRLASCSLRTIQILDSRPGHQRQGGFASTPDNAPGFLMQRSTLAGDYEESEAAQRQELEAQKELLREADHRNRKVDNSLLIALGRNLEAQSKLSEAEAEPLFRKASRAGAAGDLNEIAWRLAISPDSQFNDATNAINFAEKAVALTSRTKPRYLDTLAAAYAAAGRFTNAVKVQQEAIALLKTDEEKQDYGWRSKLYSKGIPYRDHGALAIRVKTLLQEGKFAEAESLARECLALREILIPDNWLTFNARSMLGGSLLGQKKYTEAEPLLVAGYEGMKCREHQIPPAGKTCLPEALESLVRVNEALAAASPSSAEYRQDVAAAYQQLLQLQTNSSPPASQDCSRALAFIDQAIARARSNGGIEEAAWWNTKGNLLEQLGQSEEALGAMTKAVALASANTNSRALTPTEAHLSRSRLLQQMNRLAEAAADRCQALDIPPRDPSAKTNLLDLTPFYNASLKRNWASANPQEDLAALPKGIQALTGIEFDIRGLVQVSRFLPLYPPVVTNIAVGQVCQRFHFLHAACYADQVPDGTQIGSYVVHYLNGQQRLVPLVIGQDLADWWQQPKEQGKPFVVAWTGSNRLSASLHRRIRLFKTTWRNPRPDLTILSIDFEAKHNKGSPFLVAITVE